MPVSSDRPLQLLHSDKHSATCSFSPRKDTNTVSRSFLRMRGGGQDALTRESPRKDSHNGFDEEDKENVKGSQDGEDEEKARDSSEERYEISPGSLDDLTGEFIRSLMANCVKYAQEVQACAARELAEAKAVEEPEKTAKQYKFKLGYSAQAHFYRRDSKLFLDGDKDKEKIPSAEHEFGDQLPSPLPASIFDDVKAYLMVISQEDPGAVAVATKLEEELVESNKTMTLDKKDKSKTLSPKAGNEGPSKDTSKYHSPSDSIMSPATLKLNELKGKRLTRSRDLERTLFQQDRSKQVKNDDENAGSASAGLAELKDAGASTKE